MVLVIGSSNMDLSVAVDRLPGPGETVRGASITQSCGGKGANQAVAAARAGAAVTFLSKLGTDFNGDAMAAHLAGQGLVRTILLRDEQAPTGLAMILVDGQGENQIAVVAGSNDRLMPGDVRRHEALMDEATVLLVQLEIPLEAVREALILAKGKGLRTILNPAPACPLPPDVLRWVDILTPNETEVRSLAQMDDIPDAARSLLGHGVGTVVVTCGAEGALMVSAQHVVSIPSYVVEAIDATGAGDAFNGALAAALDADEPLPPAVEWACAAGALATTIRGAQPAIPTRAAMDALRARRSLP